MTDSPDLEKLEAEFAAAIADAVDIDTLEAVRVAALGKKGRVSDLMKGLGAMSPEERKEMGPKLNGLKDRLTEALAARKDMLHEAALEARLASERIDVTLPVRAAALETAPLMPMPASVRPRCSG